MKFTTESANAQNAKWDETGRRRKPNVFALPCAPATVPEAKENRFYREAPTPKPAKRIRQGEPKLNRLESDWMAHCQSFTGRSVYAQSLRFKLANGAWYKPDVITIDLSSAITCYECKGPKGTPGVAKGLLALKVAASTYPQIRFVLVWREGGEWRIQTVLP